MAEKLFWAVFEHLGKLSPDFIIGKAGGRLARRFKRTIHLVDSTTIQLIASCMDWAKHRRRKACWLFARRLEPVPNEYSESTGHFFFLLTI